MDPAAHMIELRSDPADLRRMRAFVARWARSSRLPDDLGFRACLAATEAVTNSIRHGRRAGDHEERPIKVLCRVDAGELVIEVRDRGRFRAARANPDDDGGRGLALMRQLTRSLDVHASSDGTRIAMRVGRELDDREPPGDTPSGLSARTSRAA